MSAGIRAAIITDAAPMVAAALESIPAAHTWNFRISYGWNGLIVSATDRLPHAARENGLDAFFDAFEAAGWTAKTGYDEFFEFRSVTLVHPSVAAGRMVPAPAI